jgi:hypothetical protein
MNYSTAHLLLAKDFPDVLTEPEKYLGPNYKTVLNFWSFMDTLNEDQWFNVFNIWIGVRIEAGYLVDKVIEIYGATLTRKILYASGWPMRGNAVSYYGTLELILMDEYEIGNLNHIKLFDNL